MKRIKHFSSNNLPTKADLFCQFASVYPVFVYTAPISGVCFTCNTNYGFRSVTLICLIDVSRVVSKIHAIADLPKHVVFVNRTLMSVVLKVLKM